MPDATAVAEAPEQVAVQPEPSPEPSVEPSVRVTDEELDDILMGGTGEPEPPVVEGQQPEETVETPSEPAPPAEPEPQLEPSVESAEPTPQAKEPASPPEEKPIPDEILNVDPQKFMAKDQEYDPMDAMTFGTESYNARAKADAERVKGIMAYERGQVLRQTQMKQAQKDWDAFVESREELKGNPAELQQFVQFLSDPSQATYGDAYAVFQAAKARRAGKVVAEKKAGGMVAAARRAKSPAAVTAASPAMQETESDRIDKEIDEDFGPERGY